MQARDAGSNPAASTKKKEEEAPQETGMENHQGLALLAIKGAGGLSGAVSSVIVLSPRSRREAIARMVLGVLTAISLTGTVMRSFGVPEVVQVNGASVANIDGILAVAFALGFAAWTVGGVLARKLETVDLSSLPGFRKP